MFACLFIFMRHIADNTMFSIYYFSAADPVFDSPMEQLSEAEKELLREELKKV